jgi:hypothetical protein
MSASVEINLRRPTLYDSIFSRVPSGIGAPSLQILAIVDLPTLIAKAASVTLWAEV